VIVESPKKAKAIAKFLGPGFVVKASMGHVRDLPKRSLGVDVARDYLPQYEIAPEKKQTVQELKRDAEQADLVYLATDPDREGEAIAWHLQQALGLPDDRVRRVLFYEITERAVREAFEHVGPLDMNKVNAQQARRFLDRFVGYQVSPLLWTKIARNLSAGRVQSVAVRLIADREREIRAFVPEEYWKLVATLSPAGATAESDRFRAELVRWRGEPFAASNAEQAEAVRSELSGASYRVARLETVEKADKPDPPFKTSTLQQQATIRLRMSGKRAMRVAQELYEGIDVDGSGPVGLITYMRTDSLRVSDEAVAAVRALIEREYGPKYLPARPNQYAAGKLAQEAHEAIRPTDLALHPERIKDRLSHDQYRLYNLIYRRFVASQMTPARFEVTNVEVEAGEGLFKAQGRILRFDGYRKVLPPAGKQEDQLLPALSQGQALDLHELAATQHFTQPPPRYTEATLIKALEKENIGRPSTYAPIIQTIQDRGYVEQKERRFHATDLGLIVNDYLVHHFPKILDLKFTAHMEDELDEIVTGKEELKHVLDEFYFPFQEWLKTASETSWQPAPSGKKCPECGSDMVLKFNKRGSFHSCVCYPECKGTLPGGDGDRAEETEHQCPACGRPLRRKQGRRGPFLYCSGYPDCKQIFDVAEDGSPVPRPERRETEHACPKCGKPMILRQGPRGPFLGCSAYPKCRSTLQVDDKGNPIEPPKIDATCEKCGGPMGIKQGRRGAFLGCLNYPKCRSTAPIPEELKAKVQELASLSAGPDLKSIEVEETCPECGGPMTVRRGRRGFFLGCAGYPKCKGTQEPGPATLERIQAAVGGIGVS
jgi:DNA topoisomerase-1